MAEEKDEETYKFLLKRETLEGLDLMPTYLKISQILLLRYEEFLDLISKFNQTIKSFTDDEPDYIEFSIEPETDTTMLWKLAVRIKCSRISRANQRQSSAVVLNLNQFLSVHQSLTQQMLAFEGNNTSTTTQRQYNRTLSTGRLSIPTFDTDECCICMDRQSTLVLSCTHKLCEECFKRWSDETAATGKQTCPICRSDINVDSDFLLTEAPESDALKKAIKESMFEIAKYGKQKE